MTTNETRDMFAAKAMDRFLSKFDIDSDGDLVLNNTVWTFNEVGEMAYDMAVEMMRVRKTYATIEIEREI